MKIIIKPKKFFISHKQADEYYESIQEILKDIADEFGGASIHKEDARSGLYFNNSDKDGVTFGVDLKEKSKAFDKNMRSVMIH